MTARPGWLKILGDLIQFLDLCLRSRTSLAAENLFLREQLAFYQERKVKSQRTDNPTRLTLVLLSRWFDWRKALTLVKPKTLVAWHRKGFRLFWRWKSESGRRPIPADLQHLIRKMARENPSWGEERIANDSACGYRPARYENICPSAHPHRRADRVAISVGRLFSGTMLGPSSPEFSAWW